MKLYTSRMTFVEQIEIEHSFPADAKAMALLARFVSIPRMQPTMTRISRMIRTDRISLPITRLIIAIYTSLNTSNAYVSTLEIYVNIHVQHVYMHIDLFS
jgi:hypothetical protein